MNMPPVVHLELDVSQAALIVSLLGGAVESLEPEAAAVAEQAQRTILEAIMWEEAHVWGQ